MFKEPEVILKTNHIVKKFTTSKNETLVACNDINLNVYKGKTLGIVGESGCGKSTFVRMLVQSFSHQIAVMYLGHIVEVIPGEKIRNEAKHPYTKALLNAQFSIHSYQDKQVERLQGEVSSPLDLPNGCLFQSRCIHCTAACKTTKTMLQEIELGHQVACHYSV